MLYAVSCGWSHQNPISICMFFYDVDATITFINKVIKLNKIAGWVTADTHSPKDYGVDPSTFAASMAAIVLVLLSKVAYMVILLRQCYFHAASSLNNRQCCRT